jgi:malto-oligosyltrehalose trehalohydrolase
MKRFHSMPFGAAITPDGVRFRLWAPAAGSVDVGVGATAHNLVWHAAQRDSDGWFEHKIAGVGPGTRYRFRVDGSIEVPDPASRFNPDDVRGASEVVDPLAYEWRDTDWRGRPWHEVVIYELHVGTFTSEGTFAGVERRLDHLLDLGVTAIELMPIADFPGKRNWGYDGVLLFAPDSTYGQPDTLKALVDAAHARGLMMLQDVVYNHFGPEGNYLHRYAPDFFTDRHQTPWGAGINFDGARSRVVRDFILHNALYWLEEFHMDGLRLDAVHAIADDSSPDILDELAATIRDGIGRERLVHLVLENDRNESRRLVRDERGSPRRYTAQWNDDLHHAFHTIVTGEKQGYYGDYTDAPVGRVGRCLAEGFAYQGESSPWRGGHPRGEPSAALPPSAFVSFLQNHDQIGNRALGERIHLLARDECVRAALAIVLLAPSPPLLFMGEEFAAATPFLFFCDFEPALAAAVTQGRRDEFRSVAAFADPDAAAHIPDPGAFSSYARSKLDWRSLGTPPHAEWMALYRELLHLRRRTIAPLVQSITTEGRRWRAWGEGALSVEWPLADGRTLCLDANLADRKAQQGVARAGGIVYRSPGVETNAELLPPWSVVWSIAEIDRESAM